MHCGQLPGPYLSVGVGHNQGVLVLGVPSVQHLLGDAHDGKLGLTVAREKGPGAGMCPVELIRT